MARGIVRFGIIGLGKMGGVRAESIRKRDDAQLVCGADPARSTYAEFPDIPCSENASAVIDADIDAVVVSTPNRFAAGYVVQALDAGKHVLCEKPPGVSLEEVYRVREAEKRNPSCVLQFGFNHRYHAGILEAKRIVTSGRMGAPMWMRGIYGKAGGPGFEENWRNQRAFSGGGILMDQGIHMLDLFRFFGFEFVEVKSMVANTFWDLDVEDNAFALLRDDAGRIAMLHSSSTQWKHRFSLEVYLTEGFVSVNGILSSTRSYGDETITVARKDWDVGASPGMPAEETSFFDQDPSWDLELDNFLRHINDGTAVLSGSSADALAAMKLVTAIYEDDAAIRREASQREQ